MPIDRTVLVIAGFDPSGGAGVLRDVAVLRDHDVRPVAAITALTAQNTAGVRRVDATSRDALRAQIDAILDDLAVHAVKIGLLATGANARAVAEALVDVRVPIVLDPVLVSTSGRRLVGEDALPAIRDLCRIVALATPNASEADALGPLPCPTLITGGDAPGDEVIDRLGSREWRGPRHPVGPVRGTGCTLSSAIAANLALGLALEPAIDAAISYTRARIGTAVALGRGARLLD